jgi:hypothetical protein
LKALLAVQPVALESDWEVLPVEAYEHRSYCELREELWFGFPATFSAFVVIVRGVEG